VILSSGCAYQLGGADRSLPGGYRQVTIPIFKNFTSEPGIEVYFTNALIQEIERSRVGKIVPPEQSEIRVEGIIENVTVDAGPGEERAALPMGADLASVYNIKLQVRVTLKRQADQSILWEGVFKGERGFQAASVSPVGVNTVNPLYNLSRRRQNIESMAYELMNDSFGRITENF
jgi:hypothetical protein